MLYRKFGSQTHQNHATFYVWFLRLVWENLLYVCVEEGDCPEHKIETEKDHEIQDLKEGFQCLNFTELFFTCPRALIL